MLQFLPAALFLAGCAVALPVRKDPIAFVDPTTNGGTWFDHDSGSGLGEPLNVVISALSSPDVLSVAGILNYAKAIGYSEECLGIHSGAPQTANLGDGQGPQDQAIEIREDFGLPDLGTCVESLLGGNHFRVYVQNGGEANTGALFLAVSEEEDAFKHHTISPNGYNVGRDRLVDAAVGTNSFGGVTYSTTAETLNGIMPSGSSGVNHDIAVDGNAVLLTITIQ